MAERRLHRPLLAIAGLALCALALLLVGALDLPVVAGVAPVLLALLALLVHLERKGRGLTRMRSGRAPGHEAEYQSVLVAMPAEDSYDPAVVGTAVKLAARRRHGIHVVVTITVPNALPLDARMRAQEAAADTLVEQARVQGGRRITGHWEKVRAGQAGRRIIREAEDMRASAIVIGLPRRIPGASLFGKTVETVLADRPCRVIIESTPEGGRRDPAWTAARVAGE